MSSGSIARAMLSEEARALLTRLDRLTSFAVRVPMVPAAAVSNEAQDGIERFLKAGKEKLREMVHTYMRWLDGEGASCTPSEMQHRFTFVRLSFNVVLDQFEIFSGALTQRSEHGTGVWLAGLDALAADALTLEGEYYRAPPVICYLDRGMGAAIRRARTRLPGGDLNPVSIIRVPRERMVGSGVASSLVHEVGHQGAALLGLVPSLRTAIRRVRAHGEDERRAWSLWERWISEIVADFWSVASLGICSTLGLMSVVSLPRFFVFRNSEQDPHPIPWIRVKLSCAIGALIYPSPQWRVLSRLWEELYPTEGLPQNQLREVAALESTMQKFASLLVNHRPESTRGTSLKEIMPIEKRQPERLSALFHDWHETPSLVAEAAPTLVFAVMGQARAEGTITPEQESKTLAKLLTDWALRTALATSANCITPMRRWASLTRD